MTSSPHFEATIHCDPSSVAREFFERHEGSIFEKEETDIRIEVRCWTPRNLACYHRSENVVETSEPPAAESHTAVPHGTVQLTATNDAEQQPSLEADPVSSIWAVVDLDTTKLKPLIWVS
jgi:hypothetical protein